MAGIPLVNTNSVNDINTSIIAIKKEMKSSGETEVNVNVNLPDTAIPVDEVTSGNMHSVTSNAVARYIKNLSGTFTVTIDGNASVNQEVNFIETLPNTNYIIQYRAIITGSILFTEMNRGTSGVTVNIRNINSFQLTFTCEWNLICIG